MVVVNAVNAEHYFPAVLTLPLRRKDSEMNPYRARDPNAPPTIKQLAKAAQTERERRKEQGVPLSAWDRHALVHGLTRAR